MARRTEPRAVPHPARTRDRTGVYRPILGPSRAWRILLRRLWRTAVLVVDQVRLGHRLAKFLSASEHRRAGRKNRHQLRYGTCRGAVPSLRIASRARFSRRPRPHRQALLHKLGVAGVTEKTGLNLAYF